MNQTQTFTTEPSGWGKGGKPKPTPEPATYGMVFGFVAFMIVMACVVKRELNHRNRDNT